MRLGDSNNSLLLQPNVIILRVDVTRLILLLDRLGSLHHLCSAFLFELLSQRQCVLNFRDAVEMFRVW